jgi:thioredoxin reductase (NADPH)
MALEAINVNEKDIYDVIIIGGGPAGLTAAIYCKQAGLNIAFIEKNVPGGKIVNIKNIKNFPGFASIDGVQYANALFNQTQKLAIEYISDEVVSLNEKDELFFSYLTSNKPKCSRSVIIATGTTEEKLNVVGEDKFFQKGVTYCVHCDGALSKGKICAVVGDTYNAIEAVKYLSNIAEKIYFVSNLNIEPNEKVVQIKNSHIKQINGSDHVESVTFDDDKIIKLDYIYVCTKQVPASHFIIDKSIIDENGVITIDPVTKETNIKGIYAVGDVSKKNNKQIITALSDGAIAAQNAINYVNELKYK